MIRIICFSQGKPVSKEFNTEQIIIGRGSEGDAVDLDLSHDIAVSPRHARVWALGEEGWIEDLESAQGTQINGHEIKGKGRRRLEPGDTVKIGTTMLLVKIIAGGPRKTSTAGSSMQKLSPLRWMPTFPPLTPSAILPPQMLNGVWPYSMNCRCNSGKKQI